MNASTPRTLSLALLLVLMACTLACDEIEDDIIEVGLLQVHPVLAAQGVPVLGEDSVQNAIWTIPAASIQFADIAHELAPGGDCLFQQSYISLSTGSGECMLGAAVAVSTTPAAGILTFTSEMKLARVRQVDVTPGGDLDGDGVLNEDDNCPLIANAGQEVVVDVFEEEIGEACAFDSSGGVGDPVYFLDSELDEVPDVADNCPFHANLDQLNTPDPTLPAGFPSDGIGDACTDNATVAVGGEATFSMDVDVDPYVQERRRLLLVIDFGQDLADLTCDWTAGTCDLNSAAIRSCVLSDRIAAASGCP
jgi:hypothetical protein